MVVNKGDILELESIGINNYAKGISKVDSFLIFTDDFYPHEKALVKIVDVKKNLAFAKIEKLLVSSPYRIESVCHHSNDSGTCPFSDITYEYELELKKEIVLNNINRALNTSIKDILIYSGDKIKGYRNKVTVFFNDNYQFGYFMEDSNDFIKVDDCIQIDDEILSIINKILELLKTYKIIPVNFKKHTGIIKGVSIRKSELTSKISIMILATKDDEMKYRSFSSDLKNFNNNITGISFNINKEYDTFIYSGSEHQYYGNNAIDEKLGDIIFRVNNMSFLQVNTSCASKLYKKAIEIANLKKQDNVLDLYSGAGGISLNLASKVNHVYGIETVKSAVINARKNAIFNNINNASFFVGDAKDFNKIIKDIKIDTLFVDPPRSGLSSEAVNEILKQNFNKIIYISCDPYTLSRDLKLLITKYELKELYAFNMFVRTKHVESVVLLEHKK